MGTNNKKDDINRNLFRYFFEVIFYIYRIMYFWFNRPLELINCIPDCKHWKMHKFQFKRIPALSFHYLSFLTTVTLTISLLFFLTTIAGFTQNNFLLDEQIKAQTITRFWQGFTEYEVRLFWIPFEWEMASQYKIFKSINQGDIDEVKADYQDEGFQLWWSDKEVFERNTYTYYIEGYQFNDMVGRTEQVEVNFWLPSCPARYPVNNEIVQEEEPEFEWQSVAITTFPYKNIIFSTYGEFVIHDMTEDEEIWRVPVEDVNTNKINFNIEQSGKNLQKKHQYQWQYKVTGYDLNNIAIAESITGGLFGFQEAAEELILEEEEEEPVEGKLSIDASSVSYQIIDDEDVIVARDNVRLLYKDIDLKSNFLQIILDRNELIAKEDVLFSIGENSYTCQSLNYNWKTDKIILEDFAGETTGKNVRGLVYYQGGKMENFPDTIEITSGLFTTCDLDNPHWHIEAEHITIYLDDKIVAKKVSWYEGNKKMFTFPSFLIFLRGKNQLPYIPDIGQSGSDGWFLKNRFNYVEDASSYGSIFVDWMQKRGIGAGIEHTFELGEEKVDDGEIVLYLYALKRKAANIYDVDASINYWQNFENDLRLKANATYSSNINPGSIKNTSHLFKPDFYLYKKWEDSLLTVTGKYSFDIKNNRTSSSGNIKTTYDYTISDVLSSNLVLLYTEKDPTGQTREQWLRPEWQLRYSGKGYSLSLVTEKLFDLNIGGNDLGGKPGSPSTLDRLPELVFTKGSTPLFDTGITYSINASIGKFYESATDQENVRGEYIINLNRPFKINDNISLNASGLYRQDVYLTGEARYMLGGRLDLRLGYQPEFYGNLSYSYYMSEGPTPFNFDALTPLSESASASVVLKPIDNLQINLSTNYNFVSGTFGTLGGRLQWKPKGEHDLFFSTYYDLNRKQWNKKIDTKMSLKLSDEWKLSYSGSIYFDKFDVKNSVISVVKDLHCREISINYRQSTKSVWVDFSIKAFPTESFTIGG